MNIHDRIKHYQNQRNWTINHMAIEAGLSPGTVINWFSRKATPTFEGIESLCRAFGISVSEFFNVDNPPAIYPTETQKTLLSEWDLLHKEEKEHIFNLVKIINNKRQNSNPQ